MLIIPWQVKHCGALGISADRASTLFIFIGLASIVGRLVSGFICDFRRVNSVYVYQASMLVLGVATLLSTLATTYVPLAVYASVFGFCDGAFITTLNICLFKSVDESKRPSAMGLLHPVIAVFLATGPPVSGALFFVKLFIFSFKVPVATNRTKPTRKSRKATRLQEELRGFLKYNTRSSSFLGEYFNIHYFSIHYLIYVIYTFKNVYRSLARTSRIT